MDSRVLPGVLPVDLFVAQLVACAASFYAHVYFDKEYHVEGSRLQRFACTRHVPAPTRNTGMKKKGVLLPSSPRYVRETR
jgi:hypothetical protein